MPPGDLEGDPGDLPRLPRRLEGSVDPADLEHEHARRAELDSASQRDRVDDAAVEEVLGADLHRRQQAGYGGARQYGVHDPSGVEPVLGGPLDAGRAHLEPRGQVLEADVAELLLEPLPHRLGGVEVGAGGDRTSYRGQGLLGVAATAGLADIAPQVGEPLDDGGRGVAGDQGAVQGADAGAQHQLGCHLGLEQGAQHADLDRAEHAPSAQHEGRGHGSAVTIASGCSARTRTTTRCSTQKISSGIRPAASIRIVKPGLQPNWRASRNATTT